MNIAYIIISLLNLYLYVHWRLDFKSIFLLYTILMPKYKSYYNIAQSYLCELITQKERHVNTHLGTDFRELAFIYANGTN